MGMGLAIGHPLDATGARVSSKEATLLQRDSGRYTLATPCIGGWHKRRRCWKLSEFIRALLPAPLRAPGGVCAQC